MPSRGMELIKSWMFGCIEFLCLFPIILLIASLFLLPPNIIIWVMSLPILFLLGLILSMLFQAKKKWTYISLSIIVSTIFSYTLGDSIISIVAIFVICFIFTYRGILYGSYSREEIFSISYLWLSLITYFIGYFVFRYFEFLSSYTNIISWFGFLLIILALFITNNYQLNAASLSEQKKPKLPTKLVRHNRFFISLTILFILFITNFKIIQGFLYSVTYTILSWFSWFMSLLEVEDSLNVGPAFPELAPTLEVNEAEEPSLIMLIIERIFWFVTYTVIIVVVLFLVWYVLKKMVRWIMKTFPRVINFFREILNRGNEIDTNGGYVDEAESTIDWKDWRKDNQKRVKDIVGKYLKREKKWKDYKTNKEKVRYLYRHIISQQKNSDFSYNPSKTPKETIGELMERDVYDKELMKELEKQYGKARYSEEDIQIEKIEKIRSSIEK